MPQPDCPDRDTLEKLLLGNVPSGRAEGLEEHLLSCDDCSKVAETIHETDDLTLAFASEENIECDEEILAAAIQRAKQLRSHVETVESDETINGKSPVPAENAADSPGSPSLGEEIDFLAPAEHPDEIGRLGGYRALEVLGAGGMGIVFRAEDPMLKRQIALKVMKPVIAASKSARRRFIREAQAAAAIEHGNIVSIYQVGEERNVPYIAMQLLHGESLQKRLEREQKLDQREVLRIGREVATGLEAAHKRELIHRDIKPDNIWLEEGTGRVKIVDFGLVRGASDDAGLTRSGMVLGTPRYMAPEQALGQTVDHRCDLFSLGSVLYHLATGKAPFEGDNLTATLIAVAQQDPQPVEQIRPRIRPGLSRLIRRLLSKDRDQRPQSAAAVSQAIADIEQELAAEEAGQQQLDETRELGLPPIRVVKPGRVAKPKSGQPFLVGGSIVAIVLTIFFGLWAAGFIVKVEAEDGTLVVEVTGNDFVTSVQGKRVTIKNTETGETIGIDLNTPEVAQRLKPGRYQFQFTTDSGLTAKTDRFTVRSGVDEVVKVWWEPKGVQANMARTNTTLQHVPFDVLFDVPQRVIGVRELPETTFDNDRPEICLDAGAVNDTSQLRIIRLWFQTEDLVPSQTNSNLYLPRTIDAWVPSESMPRGGVEIVQEPVPAGLVALRPRSRLADGVYCLVEESIDDGAKLPRLSAPFTIRGVGKPTIDTTSVAIRGDQAVFQIRIRNKGKGTLNDGRMVVTLQRVTSGRSVFSGRFQPKLGEIPPGETSDVELQISATKTPPGRYYFTVSVCQTHWNGDQNKMTEGKSEEFELPPSASPEK